MLNGLNENVITLNDSFGVYNNSRNLVIKQLVNLQDRSLIHGIFF